MKNYGYKGQVKMISPTGEVITILVPGRSRYWAWDKISLVRRAGQSPEQAGREDKQFRRLLSKGWKVVKSEQEDSTAVGEEEKKDTDQVDGSTQSGNQSHGGEHSSCEVKDSPNVAEAGEQQKPTRGKRGRGGRQEQKRDDRQEGVVVKKQSVPGGRSIYCPTPIQVSSASLKSCEESAELLKKLIGRSMLKQPESIRVDALELLVALETGENPLPALERKAERSRSKILVTPDCSGSTQSWSGLGQGWAVHLAKQQDVDVTLLTNSNGEFWGIDHKESMKLVEAADIVIYLGDMDGYRSCSEYANAGATVIALDSSHSRFGDPRLVEKKIGKGHLFWISAVSAKHPESWKVAIELVLKRKG